MSKYLKKFNNHNEYETTKDNLIRPNVSYCVSENEVHYNPIDYSLLYLTFVALEDGTFSFEKKGPGNDIQYSLDNGSTWVTLSSGSSTPTVTAGSKILWKGNISPAYHNNEGIGTFSSTSRFNVEGNPLSTSKGDNFKDSTPEVGAFEVLFKNCTRLVSAENLSLKTIGSWSCWHMFEDCYSLTTAPELPATTLGYECYDSMFKRCTNLKYIKCLATNISANRCTVDWVSGVASNGTFVKAASMTSWTSGESGIPTNWTVEDA